jgi:ferritin-like metal-binding protein YciE
MLSDKELMHLEDFLEMEQTYVKTLNHLTNTIQDNQCKQIFQQMAQKNQQNFQNISKHLSASQTLQ